MVKNKKSVKKKRVSKKTSAELRKKKIKKEFDEFANKVAKLEAMRHEVNSLDTTGFQPRVKIIKAKLKNINQISQVRRELNKLEEAIKRKHSRGVLRSKSTKKLLEKSKSVEQDHKIMKGKIKELENKLSSKRKLACKKQLSKKEVEHIKDLPKLGRQLNELKKDFAEHTRVSRIKIDSGVGILVDTRFADFINEIKAELTERLKSKEMAIDMELKADLEKHEEFFQRRYSDLVDEFHQKYKSKVDAELKRDVNRRFKDKLGIALQKKKKELVEKLIKEDAIRLSSEKNQMMEELQSKYQIKKQHLSQKYKGEERVLIKEYKGKEQVLFKGYKDREKLLEQHSKKMKEDMHNRLIRKSQSLERDYKQKLSRGLSIEEGKLRKQLEKEYKDKLESEMKVKEAQIEKKKQELKRHVVAQARKLLAV